MSKMIYSTLEKVCLQEKGSIISGPFGSNISSKFFVDQGIPVIRGNNLTLGKEKFIDDGFVFVTEQKANELNCYAVPGDLIFTGAGTLGQVGLISDDLKYKRYVISNKQLRARIDTRKVDLLYAYYWFSSTWIQQYFITNNKGSTVPLVSLSELKDAPITYPESLEEQRSIALMLEQISHKLNINTTVCSELESMAKTLYDYWFVQFDFPDADGNPYRASGGEMVWNDQLKREIPKGWVCGTIGELGTIISGGTPSTSNETYYSDNGIAWITPNDLSGNESLMFIGHGERDITSEGLENSSAVLMPAQSVLFSSRAPIGYIAIANNAISTNQGFKSVVPDKGYGSYIIYYTIKSNTPAIARQGVGTTFKEVSGETLKMFKIVLPPMDIAGRFEEQLISAFKRRRLLEEENRELTKLRDWLLPMLMNGQATVMEEGAAPKLKVIANDKPASDPRFDRWLQTQGVAARGNVDEQTLHDIFDAMDDDDKQ